jgi:hypothetical protein
VATTAQTRVLGGAHEAVLGDLDRLDVEWIRSTDGST